MPKTITLRLAEKDYRRIKKAAESENRTISNFIETHVLHEVVEKNFIQDEEMADILKNDNLLSEIQSSLGDVKKGKYKIVK